MSPAPPTALAATWLLVSGAAAAEPPADDFDPGPAIGAALPALGLADQTGAPRTFEDLRGPEGLLLLVYRSADW